MTLKFNLEWQDKFTLAQRGDGRTASLGGKNKISVRCQELAGDAQMTDEYQGLSLR